MAAGDGLVSMAPTSIAYSGTSAGINADGGVDFSAVTSLSLNGVFTSAYDNYLVVFGPIAGSTGVNVFMRYRASGSDNSTASSYTYQLLQANSTFTNGAFRESQSYQRIADPSATQRSGYSYHIYGPYLAQPTAFRCTSIRDYSSATIDDWAGTHNQSTSYDGFTIYVASGNFTGTIHVFGYEE
jgi:hypothetical protein